MGNHFIFTIIEVDSDVMKSKCVGKLDSWNLHILLPRMVNYTGGLDRSSSSNNLIKSYHMI